MSKPLSNVMNDVAPHRFTSDEYYRLVELRFFESRRVELIQGEIIAMPPMGSPHATTLTLILQCQRGGVLWAHPPPKRGLSRMALS